MSAYCGLCKTMVPNGGHICSEPVSPDELVIARLNTRISELERQLKVAREALEKIMSEDVGIESPAWVTAGEALGRISK